MPQLAIAPSFLDDFSRMDRAIQLATLSVMRDFIAGRRVEASDGTDVARVLSLGPEWSGVVVPTSDDLYCLVTVRPHDDAVAFARAYQPEAAPEPLTGLPAMIPAPRRPDAPAEPITASDDLHAAARAPFDEWRRTLHPAQRRLTDGSVPGSMLVSGSPATGVGVLTPHRAAVLAQRARAAAPVSTGPGQPEPTEPTEPAGSASRVLLVTAQSARAQHLNHQLDALLPDPDVRTRVDVTTIGALAHGIVVESLGHRPQTVTREELVTDWNRMASADGLPFGGRFLVDEWEHVILAQRITDPAAYLRCDRDGRHLHLAPEYRRGVWRAIQRYTGALRAKNTWARVQVAARAAETVRRSGPRYRHIVVDAVHAFHPTQLRLVRALAPEDTDDLFLVGDPAQRVTDSRVSFASLGIRVRGRSRILRRGYRTTREIEEFAVGIRAEGAATTRHAALHGPRPTVHRATNRAAEYAALTQRVRQWLAEGTEPHSVAVAGRNQWVVRRLTKELAATGIRTAPVTAVDDPDAVRVDTMHQLAGQEFRRVALVGLGDALIPPRAAVRSAGGDATTVAQAYRAERVVLYAAAMSARDALYVSCVDTPSRLLPAD